MPTIYLGSDKSHSASSQPHHVAIGNTVASVPPATAQTLLNLPQPSLQLNYSSFSADMLAKCNTPGMQKFNNLNFKDVLDDFDDAIANFKMNKLPEGAEKV